MKNDDIKKILNSSVTNNKILHSYMFIGSNFTDKEQIANDFAKQILCINNNNANCNCKSCIGKNNNNHPDFKSIDIEDGEKSIKIEQIRKMQEDIIKKPIISDKQVYIINNAENMTVGAQNCLLKTLEEPPKYATIILLIKNENLILNTIKSRCIKMIFTDEKRNQLTDDQTEIYKKLECFFGNVKNYTLLDAIKELEFIYKSENKINEILEYINMILYNNMQKDIRYIEYIRKVEETKQRLKMNTNYNMSIDNLLFSIFNY